MKKKILVLTVLSLIYARPAHALIPVTDFFAWIQHGLTIAVHETTNVLQQWENESTFIINRRLGSWTPTEKYRISPDDTPEWRIYDWWTTAVFAAREFHRALTYGNDPSGIGYATVTVPRRPPVVDEGDLTPDVRHRLAGLDLSDSVMIRAAHDLGRERYAGRALGAAITTAQEEAVNDTDTQAMNAVIGKLTGQSLTALRNSQAQLTRKTAMVELMAVQAKRDRDLATDHLNMQLTTLDDNGEVWRTATAGSGAYLRRLYR